MERQSSFSYEEILACGRGELFGPGNAQLPLPPMLMFDRITQIAEEGGEHGKGLVRAELDVRPDLWFFDCHFKGDPVMPGCLGLDALWQLTGFFLGWLGLPGSRPTASASIPRRICASACSSRKAPEQIPARHLRSPHARSICAVVDHESGPGLASRQQ